MGTLLILESHQQRLALPEGPLALSATLLSLGDGFGALRLACSLRVSPPGLCTLTVGIQCFSQVLRMQRVKMGVPKSLWALRPWMLLFPCSPRAALTLSVSELLGLSGENP